MNWSLVLLIAPFLTSVGSLYNAMTDRPHKQTFIEGALAVTFQIFILPTLSPDVLNLLIAALASADISGEGYYCYAYSSDRLQFIRALLIF